MIYRTIILLTCSFGVLAEGLFAQSPIDREFEALRQQQDKAVAAATEPLKKRYQASLEQLLRKATQANDLDAAVKIREAIGALGVAPAVSGVATPTPTRRSDFVGMWIVTYPGGSKFTRELKSNGDYITNTGKKGKWQVTSKHLRLDLGIDSWEQFELPMGPNPMSGTNQGAQIIQAQKLAQ